MNVEGDAISRDEMRHKLIQLRSRTAQWGSSSFRAGYRKAVDFALSDLEGCRQLEGVTVTRCKDCQYATERHATLVHCTVFNRSKNPDDFCNYGEPDF